MKEIVTIAASLLALLLPACKHGRNSGLAPDEIYFVQEVKPLLEGRCLPCHNGHVLEGGLDLTSAASAFENRPTGPVIIPGQPGKSKLLTVILAAESHPQAMPPSGHGLNEVQILTLEKWIQNGAMWPAGPKGHLTPAPGAEPRSVDAHTPTTTPIS